MKILNIQFENINALKGEWKIDFEQPPLKGAGIFAVTGPNGSGKTTLLDAVSLGLYGRTSRLAIPGVQVMNPAAAACSAGVTFGINGSRYHSSWTLEAKNGDALLPQMALYEIKEAGEKSLLTRDMKQVRDQVADLTGLDFNRFRRSVMLAQGEFAAFMTAVGNEQIEVLENIAGTEIYDAHPARISAQADAEMEKLMEIKAALAPLEAEKRADTDTLRQEIEQLNEQEAEAKEKARRLKQHRQYSQQQQEIKKRLEEKQIALSKAQTRSEAVNKEKQRLERANKAAALKNDIDVLETQNRELARQQQRLEELTGEAATLKSGLAEIEKRETVLSKGIEEAGSILSEKGASFDRALETEKKVSAAHQAFREQVEQYEALEKAQQANLHAQVEIKEKIKENKKKHARVSDWLEQKEHCSHLDDAMAKTRGVVEEINTALQEKADHETRRKAAEKPLKKAESRVDKARRSMEKDEEQLEKMKIRSDEFEAAWKENMNGHSYETLEARLNDQKEQLSHSRPMIRMSKAYFKLTAGNGKELKKEAGDARTAYSELLETVEKEKNILATLERVARFESERELLKPNEACPLCGSADHPYIEKGLPFEGDAAQAVSDQSGKVAGLKADHDRLFSRMESLEAKYDAIESMKEEWEEMCRAVDLPLPLGDVKAVKSAFNDLKKEHQKLKARLQAIRKHRRKNERMENTIQKTADRIAEKQMRINELEDQLKIQQGIVATLEKEGEAIEGQIQQAHAQAASILEPYGEKPPEAGAELLLLDRLDAQKTEYLHQKKMLNDLGREGEKLAGEAASLPEKLKEIKQKSDALEGQVKAAQAELTQLKTEQDEVNSEGDLLKEKNELESHLQQQQQEKEQVDREKETLDKRMAETEHENEETAAAVQTLQTSIKNLEQMFDNKLLASGFKDVQDVRESLLLEEEAARIQATVEETETALTRCRQQVEAVQEDVRENGAEIEDMPPEQMEQELKEVRELADNLAETKKSRKEALARQEELKKEYNTLMNEYEAQQALCNQLAEKEEFYASADPLEVKNRVREHVFEQLVEGSNRQLASLSGRYALKRCHKGDSWGFAIEDVKQKGEARSVETLSGGEQFLVSLSLALGLSEMADSSRKIDSLFIDEGFGNLDEDSLQNVLITLNSLKANGKLVGVISHVKKFEERIPVQIRLSKEPGGGSKMEVVA